MGLFIPKRLGIWHSVILEERCKDLTDNALLDAPHKHTNYLKLSAPNIFPNPSWCFIIIHPLWFLHLVWCCSQSKLLGSLFIFLQDSWNVTYRCQFIFCFEGRYRKLLVRDSLSDVFTVCTSLPQFSHKTVSEYGRLYCQILVQSYMYTYIYTSAMGHTSCSKEFRKNLLWQ